MGEDIVCAYRERIRNKLMTKEKIKWYNNSVKEIQLKDSDPIPHGFIKGRLPRPKKIDALKKLVSKEDIYNKFIIENVLFKDLGKFFNISDSDVRVLLTYYKIKKDPKKKMQYAHKHHRTHEESVRIGKKSSITQKKSWEMKSEEEKSAWAQKCSDVEKNLPEEKRIKKSQDYRNWWFGLSEQERESINEKRRSSCRSTWNSNKDSLMMRKKQTERENRKNRLCRSASEQKAYDALLSIFPDTQYDVRVDDRYPFYCDFYIPSKDLFIELNAHPSHGRLPLDLLSFDEYSKYPAKWADVFGRRDVEKASIAKKNRINYIRIYPRASMGENLSINPEPKIVELLYQSQS